MNNQTVIVSIDDEPAILRCLSEALKSHGYVVHTFTDPVAGLKHLQENQTVSLALLDVKMPIKNGFEIYRELREKRKLPVIFVTAYPGSFNSKSDEVVKMWKDEFADGTTDIIYKPFDLPTLYEKVEALIGRSGQDSSGA